MSDSQSNQDELGNSLPIDPNLIDPKVSGSSQSDISLDPSDLSDVTVNPASFGSLQPKPKETKETANLDMLLDIGLKVTVELGRAKMTIRDVLSLGPGKVVELNRIAGEPVDVLVNGKPIAKGEVVVIGDMFGVRVTDIIPPAQRVESMA